MSDISFELTQVIGQPESETLEYKAVLPPSKLVAQLICAFANSQGGYIILGVSENSQGIDIKGLSDDFHATSITHKALDLCNPQPTVSYQYFNHEGKKLYGIKVGKSESHVYLENKIYTRKGSNSVIDNPETLVFRKKGFDKIQEYSDFFAGLDVTCTISKHKLIDHYQSVLKIFDDLSASLYPNSPLEPTNIPEGKILTRILFSSCVDNFEGYLSDLLFEIFLAKPETLKSKQEITVEEVLNCSDIQEFVRYYARQKLLKLQKGSVKGFISENKQISALRVIDPVSQAEIEAILQIRHLYSHRNGIVDEKFQQYFPGYALHLEHAMSIDGICEKLLYLVKIADLVDREALQKYDLATT